MLVLCAGSFYAGVFVGMHIDQSGSDGRQDDCWTVDDPRLVKYIQDTIQAQSKEQQSKSDNVYHVNPPPPVDTNDSSTTRRIPENHMGNIVYGMSRVNRDEFATKFDMLGVPLDPTTPGNKDVLILYNGQKALPTNPFLQNQMVYGPGEIPIMGNIDEATQNCNNLHIVLTQPQRDNQCIAIMGQYESFQYVSYLFSFFLLWTDIIPRKNDDKGLSLGPMQVPF